MMLIEQSPVPSSALPVTRFKDHLRLGSGFSDDGVQDGLLEINLRAAIAMIEARTGKMLITRDFRWTLGAWRDARRQPLPLAPVSAIASVVMIDAQGDETTLASDHYILHPDMQRPALLPRGGCLPFIAPGGSVRIVVTAGFGSDWADLPSDLAQAVMLLAAHFYDHRHDVDPSAAALPASVLTLIESYRTVRLLMGGRS